MLQGTQDNNFNVDAINFIKVTEGWSPSVYSDSVGVPTIGIGYALLTKESNGNYIVKSTLQSNFNGVHVFTPGENVLLQKVASDLNNGALTQSQRVALANLDFNARGKNFSFVINSAQGMTLLNSSLSSNIASAHLNNVVTALAGTKELVALEDMVYNGPGFFIATVKNPNGT